MKYTSRFLGSRYNLIDLKACVRAAGEAAQKQKKSAGKQINGEKASEEGEMQTKEWTGEASWHKELTSVMFFPLPLEEELFCLAKLRAWKQRISFERKHKVSHRIY